MHWFLIRLNAECGWNIIVRCCSLSVSCISSAIGVDWWVVNFLLANWSLSCYNCSNNSAKGWWVSVCSQYLSDDSFSPLGIVCLGGKSSRGSESWVVGTSSVSWLSYLVVMVCVLWCIPKVFSRPFKGNCLQSQDMCKLQWQCVSEELSKAV